MLNEFTESPYSQSFREGESGELRCIAPNAVPKPEIIWYKDGKIVERSQEGHIIYSNDDSLLITPVSLADEGRYYCVARNLMGQRKSDTAIISVYDCGICWLDDWVEKICWSKYDADNQPEYDDDIQELFKWLLKTKKLISGYAFVQK
ncbi:unnamed protein product [Enterobius vermicularis]|uniref:Ig-like domain-containing protein n=1 Tax=Enterobius vermicularis TaxID=51028 RepID=A0A0N4VQM4_ENTVE|nr:unnamed protein product [Enterobius vermicularis]